MLIQINSDKNIESTAASIAHFSEIIKEQLLRFEEHITRVDVHLSDVNGDKENGADKQCLMETKIKGGRKPHSGYYYRSHPSHGS